MAGRTTNIRRGALATVGAVVALPATAEAIPVEDSGAPVVPSTTAPDDAPAVDEAHEPPPASNPDLPPEPANPTIAVDEPETEPEPKVAQKPAPQLEDPGPTELRPDPGRSDVDDRAGDQDAEQASDTPDDGDSEPSPFEDLYEMPDGPPSGTRSPNETSDSHPGTVSGEDALDLLLRRPLEEGSRVPGRSEETQQPDGGDPAPDDGDPAPPSNTPTDVESDVLPEADGLGPLLIGPMNLDPGDIEDPVLRDELCMGSALENCSPERARERRERDAAGEAGLLPGYMYSKRGSSPWAQVRRERAQREAEEEWSKKESTEGTDATDVLGALGNGVKGFGGSVYRLSPIWSAPGFVDT